MTLPERLVSRLIQSGKHWQNGFIESFIGKLRDELLFCEIFTLGSDLENALDELGDYYNQKTHLGLIRLTPSSFEEGLVTQPRKQSYGTKLVTKWGPVRLSRVGFSEFYLQYRLV